ncbi:hypothetical protein CY34DRAFT_94434, partial [Suillus luteus UH-Slu-Lm8-n1]
FPTSFNRSKTMFTFRVLNDFLLDNLECGTLAINYYSKLWQMTSGMFLHLVPNQYQELMRITCYHIFFIIPLLKIPHLHCLHSQYFH